MTWEQLNNSHAGMCAYIFGRGPSLDRWHESGIVIPENAFSIGINSVCLAMPVDFSVSGDVDANLWMGTDTTWVRGVPYLQHNNGGESWHLPDECLWFLTTENTTHGRNGRLKQTRDEIARYHRLYCASSSLHPAIHLAWYLGASDVVLVGVDGSGGRCRLTEATPGRQPPPDSVYRNMKVDTEELCNKLYTGSWAYWKK